MTIRRVALLLMSTGLLTVACTAGTPADPVTEPRGATSSAAPTEPPTVVPTQTPTESPTGTPAETTVATPSAEPSRLRLPGMDAGTKTVLKAGPRKGSMVVGDVPPGKDELWVLFKCRGQGKAEIILEPGINMPFTCLDDVISPIMNRLDLGDRKTLTVRVQAPDTVEWALRVTR